MDDIIKDTEEQVNFISLIAPILSITILVLGMGCLTTYTTLRLHDFGVTDWLIGLISACYFVGLTIGGYKSQHLVLRVGHIRSYAVFSASFAVSALLQGLFEYPGLWCVLRFVSGFTLAGCFLVIESWLLGASNRSNRGIMLAIYMISYYGGQAFGQLFLKIPGLLPLEVYVIGAIFFTASILPVATTRFHAPYAEEPSILSFDTLHKKAPVALWGALGAGFTLSGLYSLYPLYLSYSNWSQGDVASIIFALLFGATAGQYPVGWLSDRIDRRKVIGGSALACCLVAIVITFDHHDFYRLMAYTALLGAASFTIYPLSINHGLDNFASRDTISATASIMLAYGIGSIVGPGFTSIMMHDNVFDTNGFVYTIIASSLVITVYIIYSVINVRSMLETVKGSYTPVPDTTFEVVQMDPDLKDKYIDAHHIDSIEDDN